MNGERKGGKEYYDEKLVYEGGYMNGERNGIGKLYNYEYLIYEGDIKMAK